MTHRDDIASAANSVLRDTGTHWPGVETREPDGQLFGSLRALFSDRRRIETDDEFVAACGNAVFAMMPTMARNSVRVDAFRRFCRDQNFADLDPFVHGSWSATSKFLFFWEPSSFAIWDSRVRRAINKGLSHGSKIGALNGGQYGEYTAALKILSEDQSLMNHIQSKFQPAMHHWPFFQGIRRIEVALYVIGQKPVKENLLQ